MIKERPRTPWIYKVETNLEVIEEGEEYTRPGARITTLFRLFYKVNKLTRDSLTLIEANKRFFFFFLKNRVRALATNPTILCLSSASQKICSALRIPINFLIFFSHDTYFILTPLGL